MGLVFGWTFTQKTISKKKKHQPPKAPMAFGQKNPRSFTEKIPQKRTPGPFFFPQKNLQKKHYRFSPRKTKKTTSNLTQTATGHQSSMGICESSMRNGKKNKTSSPWVWMVMNPMLTGKKITEKKQMARNYQSPKLAPHICPNQPDVSFFLREIFEWVPPTIPIWRGRGMVQFLRKRAYLFIIALGCSVFPGKRQWLKWKV